MTLPISVFIIAKNEADRIPLSIRSVRDWVDEVIVIDSGSEDETVKVSEELGARVVFNEWPGYGPQKVFGEGLCRNKWLLNIDADEEITPELAQEIKALFSSGEPPLEGYRLPILPIQAGQTSGHPWTARHKPVRLYRKDKAGFKDELVHDSVVLHPGARSAKLKGMVKHRSFRSLWHHVEKTNFYSSAQAEVLEEKGKAPGALILLTIPLLAFLKAYVLRREFVNGTDGIVNAHMYAFQRFIRLAKTRERRRVKASKDDRAS